MIIASTAPAAPSLLCGRRALIVERFEESPVFLDGDFSFRKPMSGLAFAGDTTFITRTVTLQ